MSIRKAGALALTLFAIVGRAHALGHKHPTPTPDPAKSKGSGHAGVGAESFLDPEPRHVAPVPIKHPLGANGAGMSWDGRIYIGARFTASGGHGWLANVLRPQRIVKDSAGVPDFTQGAFSPDYELELDGTPNTGMDNRNVVTFCPFPGVAENPFRCEADGTANGSGAYECYDILILTHLQASSGNGSNNHVGHRHARVIVRKPRTPDAEIERAEILEPLQDLKTRDGKLLKGIEPTVTFDGRLLIWQGHPKNDGSIDYLVYSFNDTPGATTGWSTPRSLPDIYNVDRDTLVDGKKLQDRWPIARDPFRAADGSVYGKGDLLHGAYPWIAHDGTEVFYSSVEAGIVNVNRARRGGTTVLGRWTGNAARMIDGPINPDRNTTVRLFFFSPGAVPTFWTPFRDVPDPAIPYTAARPVFPLFGANTSDYCEVSFEDHEDGDYVLALRMNELVTRDGAIDPTHTPDTSGRFNNGQLQGARFPIELDGSDENRGRVGQAIYFGDADKVTVKNASSLSEPVKGLTVGLFVKRLVDLHRDAENRFRYLVNKQGAFDLILEQDGSLTATVVVNGQQRRANTNGMTVPLGDWGHVAFTYNAETGTLRTYVNGALANEASFPPGDVGTSSSDLIVGPGGQRPAAPFIGAKDPIVILDELLVSRVVRTEREIARSAFRDVAPPALAPPIALPRGLSRRELRIPAASPVDKNVAELGKKLFEDTRLSRDGTISCATCHDPGKAFTDGKPRAVGLGGKTLPRNTPTIFNRALSGAQFFDGRAASLEDQSLMPLTNPDEMGMTLDGVVNVVASDPDYVDRFTRFLGGAPSPDKIARALATFERTVLSADSAYDRFIAGDASALGDSEKRGLALFQGKARCVACHVGSNFTDESFHSTAQTDGKDGGRETITGRRKDRGAFKTPSLRNVALTAPYLHDGSQATLEAVVDLYDKGGNGGERDGEIFSLGLSAQEKADLVAFLRALTGN